MESTNRSCSVNLSIVSSFGSSKYWFLSYHQSCSSRPMKGARNLPSLKLTANLPLKTNGWKMKFPFGMAYFQGQNVGFRVPGYPKWKVSRPWFGRLPGPWLQHVSGSNGVMLMLQQLIADAKERRNFAHFDRFLLNAKKGPTYPVSASTSK